MAACDAVEKQGRVRLQFLSPVPTPYQAPSVEALRVFDVMTHSNCGPFQTSQRLGHTGVIQPAKMMLQAVMA